MAYKYRCGCIIVVLYPWYYTTIFVNSPKPFLCYTTLPNHSHSWARLGKHKIKTGTGTTIMFNSKQFDRQIPITRDTKFCKWLQKLCSDSGYEAELEEDPSARMKMVVVVALMNLIALTYPRASTTCMTRISSKPRRWWARVVTSTHEVVWMLYNTFGII